MRLLLTEAQLHVQGPDSKNGMKIKHCANHACS
jgi:hypothetical protein